MEFEVSSDDLEEHTNMPYCAEKLLIALMHSIPQDDNKTLFKKLDELKERIGFEGLYTYEVNILYKEIINSLNKKEFGLAFSSLRKIHDTLRSLNIPKLLRLIKESDNALEIVKDKNIYLLIGHTGSGKYYFRYF